MKKIFNFRPIVIICLFFMLGILYATYSLWSVSIVNIFAILLICLLVFIVFFAFYRKDIKIVYLFFMLSCILAFLFAGILSNVRIKRFMQDDVGNDKYVISGNVYDINLNSGYLTLKDVTLTNSKFDIYELNGKLLVFFKDDLPCEVGDVLIYTSKYTYTYDENGKINTKYINNNIVGLTNCSSSNVIHIEKGNLPLRNKIINLFNKTNEKNYLSESSFGIAKAFIFGDRTDFSEESKNVFSTSGVMHLFAVSGLHIGFLAGIVSKLLNMLTKKRKLSSSIIFVILFIYAYVCGFSASVTRALIMMGVVLIANVSGRQYDGLNSLALSALIILIISPFQMFSIGFILSFCVVFSLFNFSPCILAFLNKFLPRNFASYLSVVVAAQIGSIPIVAYAFNMIQLTAFFSNILSVFIATFVYGLLFCIFCISVILPFCSFLYVIPNYLVNVLLSISVAISNLNINIMVENVSLVFVFVYFVGILLSGEYSFIKRKYVIFICAFSLFFISLLVNNI